MRSETLAQQRGSACSPQAKAQGDLWRRAYSQERPHSSLGSLTPSEFAAGLAALEEEGRSPERKGSRYHNDQGTLLRVVRGVGAFSVQRPPIARLRRQHPPGGVRGLVLCSKSLVDMWDKHQSLH